MALSNEELKATGSDDSFIEILDYIKVKYNLTVHLAECNIACLSYDDGFEIGKLEYNRIVEQKYRWESPYTKGKRKDSNERIAKNVAGLKRSLASAIVSYENYISDLVKDVSRGSSVLENWVRTNNNYKSSLKVMYNLKVEEWHALLQMYLEGQTEYPFNMDTYKKTLADWNNSDDVRNKQANIVNYFFNEDIYVIGENHKGVCMVGELKRLNIGDVVCWTITNFRICTNDTLPEKLIGKMTVAKICYENNPNLTSMGLPSVDSNYNEDLEIITLSRYGSTTSYYKGISWAIIKV
jgi:hypothetical protein